MRFSYKDDKLLDAIAERGEASTPEEQAALDRFSTEFEAAFKLFGAFGTGTFPADNLVDSV